MWLRLALPRKHLHGMLMPCYSDGMRTIPIHPSPVMQALYGIGFLLACVYHVCHMDEAGLIASRVLGVSGPVWRSADVYMAQWLLGRMWGHALKASHPITSGTVLSQRLTCLVQC